MEPNDERLKITVPRLVVGGVRSGVGKTTFVAGLVGALRRRGLRVAPFKVGPDYIDPSYHARMAGLPCRNLDSWMVPRDAIVELFARATNAADVAIVEGVMGLYDGRNGCDDEGSTAEVAKLLGAPVVLMVDVGKTSRSAGAVVLGFRDFDPGLNLAGAILNRVGSAVHRQWVSEAVEIGAGLPVFGCLPGCDDLVLPERHLGLIPTGEAAPDDDFFECLIGQVEASVAVDRLLDLARSAPHLAVGRSGIFPEVPKEPRVRVGLALDRAFTFYYEDNLDLLRAWGADLVPFSPIEDSAIPDDLDGLYIGGGFPELFAGDLADNHSMLRSICAAAGSGLPVYAECGGLMYLSEGIVDFEGRRHSLVGAIPTWSSMAERLTMGYRVASARIDNLLLERGENVRGHEFHWSELASPVPAETAAYELVEKDGRFEGYARGNILASYLHLHFASRPDLARRFVAACEATRAGTSGVSSGGSSIRGSGFNTELPILREEGPPGMKIYFQGRHGEERKVGGETGGGSARSATAPAARSLYPVCLDVVGRRCVVIGGGEVAERKVVSLLEAGAHCVVISPELAPRLCRLRDDGRLEHVSRPYLEGDLAGAFLAIAATDDGLTNQAVADEAGRRGVLVNVADDPSHCDFTLPAVLRRGDILVTISTGARSPAIARRVREEIERFLTSEHVVLLEIASAVRTDLRTQGLEVSGDVWNWALDDDLLGLVRRGKVDVAREVLTARLIGQSKEES